MPRTPIKGCDRDGGSSSWTRTLPLFVQSQASTNQSHSNLPGIMEDCSDMTVDSLVMARRIMDSHNPTRMEVTKAQDESLIRAFLEQEQQCDSLDEDDVFLSPVKIARPKADILNTPQVISKGRHSAPATPSQSPNGVMDGPYGQDSFQSGNDSMDFGALTQTPVKPSRRRSSTTSPSPRRRSRAQAKESKNESLVTSPRRGTRTSRCKSTKRRSSKTTRVLPSASAQPSLDYRATQVTGLQALQTGGQSIAFPNFQDSFISRGSSTDATPCPAFHDSAFSLSLEGSNMFRDDVCPAEGCNEEPKATSPAPRRPSPVRRRSTRQARTSALSHRSPQLQQSTPQLLAADFIVASSPRRTHSHRLSKRPPTPPTRTTTVLQQRKLQVPNSPVTRYELERRQVLAAELCAEIKTTAADRRRRRHSSIEQQILKQKCNPRRREADLVGQALNDMESFFNDSFSELIQRRRSNIHEY